MKESCEEAKTARAAAESWWQSNQNLKNIDVQVFTVVTKNAETQTELPYKREPEDNSTSTQTEQFRNLYEDYGKHSHKHNFWLKQIIYNDVKKRFHKLHWNEMFSEIGNYPSISRK